jgi:hypothetical protein
LRNERKGANAERSDAFDLQREHEAVIEHARRVGRSSTFDLSRYMGASLTMIDRHHGHLARDGREHAIRSTS